MKIIRITAKRPGFRRAGLGHPDQPIDHPVDRFDAAQLAALKAEPGLIVQEMEIPDEDGPAKGRAK